MPPRWRSTRAYTHCVAGGALQLAASSVPGKVFAPPPAKRAFSPGSFLWNQNPRIHTNIHTAPWRKARENQFCMTEIIRRRAIVHWA